MNEVFVAKFNRSSPHGVELSPYVLLIDYGVGYFLLKYNYPHDNVARKNSA